MASRNLRTKRKGSRPAPQAAARFVMSDTISEKLHDFAEKVETDIKQDMQKHEEAKEKRDKEIRDEKKMFEKKHSTVEDANMLALEDEDIVTDD